MNVKNQGACVLLWSLVISVVAAAEQTTQGPGCKREECVPVSQCPPLRERLIQSPTEDSFKEIRKLTCFVKKMRPWVCCPSTAPPPSPSSKLTQSLLPDDCGNSNYIPVFEGEDAPLNTYPWKAVLQYRVISERELLTNRVLCSGSVINERYVLIPAQCVFKNMTEDLGIELVEVLLGEWDISTDPDCANTKGREYCAPPVQRFSVEEVTMHPDFFTRGILSDDIALIRLSRPIDFKGSAGFIQPVCLPRADDSPAEAVLGGMAIITSWNNSFPRPHNHVLSYVDKATCEKVLRGTYVKEQTSAGFVLLVALMSRAQVSHGQGANCPHECIKLKDCPSLAQLLTNPSASDVKTLQEATCTIGSSGLDPLVCCDDSGSTRPRPAPLTQPLTSPDPDPVIRQTECGRTFPLAIVGGETAAFEDEIWLALLGYRDSSSEDIQFLCAGSLINERYVVTAAHCVNPALLKPKQFKLEVIRVGEKDLLSETNCNETPRPRCIPPSQDFVPEDIIQHPGYDSKTFANDVAIIRLGSPVNFFTFESYAGPACLPPTDESADQLANRRVLFAVDWGLTRTPSQFLKRYTVALVDTNDCNTTYNGRLTAGQICVHPEDTDACSGDGGSPLTAPSPKSNVWQLLGVQTIGVGCGLSNLPTVYTSVSYHRDWIEQNIRA